MPDAQPHPLALRAMGNKERTQVVTGEPKQTAFPAQWFMAYSALSPVSGLF